MDNQIFILSQPVKSGKTTLLKSWVDAQDNIGGILTPDVNNKRMLYDISEKTYYTFQTHNTENSIGIGKFLFDNTAFNTAQDILLQGLKKQYSWMVVDEVGRLEIDEKLGLEPRLTQIIHAYKNHQVKGNLLLVIRDYLLQDAIDYYQIPRAEVLDESFFKTDIFKHATTHQNLIGLVLCGGQSERMGRDKAFITYHKKPQYAHVADMLQPFCDEVYISCNAQQKEEISQYYKCIEDNATFNNAGPLTGILSACKLLPQQSLMVIGCDYPNLTYAEIRALLDAREPDTDVVCFKNTDTNFEEPLLAIYEKQCAPLLLKFYQNGEQSLRYFIKSVSCKTLTVNDNEPLRSLDR
jgi:molybdopterin-guanine dinucleotide biosynthesis protein A/nucleoside-triphosphatase THEP1